MGSKLRTYEFWAIDEYGKKYNDYIQTKHARNSKIKKKIEEKYQINIEKCQDFGMRDMTE